MLLEYLKSLKKQETNLKGTIYHYLGILGCNNADIMDKFLQGENLYVRTPTQIQLQQKI